MLHWQHRYGVSLGKMIPLSWEGNSFSKVSIPFLVNGKCFLSTDSFSGVQIGGKV